MNKKTITSVMGFLKELELAYDDVDQTITVRDLDRWGRRNILAVVCLGSSDIVRVFEECEYAYDDVDQTITVRSLGGNNIFAVVCLGSFEQWESTDETKSPIERRRLARPIQYRRPNRRNIVSVVHNLRLMRKKYHLGKSVEELDVSVRLYNCLKNANIRTIGELVQKTEAEMLKTKNFGRKSLNGIRQVLSSMGLDLGMDLSWFEECEYAYDDVDQTMRIK